MGESWELAMKGWRTLAFLCLVMTIVCSFTAMTANAQSDSGSFTVNPGQTVYVSFGSCGPEELVLWSVSVSTLSTVFSDWLQKPDGTHVALQANTWGAVTDTAGEWKLGFSIDASGFWDATVTYQVVHARPSSFQITLPGTEYVNTPTFTVTGNIDLYATYVNLSTDNVHFVPATVHLTSWSCQLQLSAGTNTIYAETTYVWGAYRAVFSGFSPAPVVVLDTEVPTVSVTAPAAGALIRGDYVDVSWQAADDIRLDKTEMKIDGLGWSAVDGSDVKHLWFGSGSHTIQIRVSDEAGNQAVSSVSFRTDNRALSFNGPYYGLPVIAVIVAVVLVALLIGLTLLKRRRVSATPRPQTPPPQPPETPPGAS